MRGEIEPRASKSKKSFLLLRGRVLKAAVKLLKLPTYNDADLQLMTSQGHAQASSNLQFVEGERGEGLAKEERINRMDLQMQRLSEGGLTACQREAICTVYCLRAPPRATGLRLITRLLLGPMAAARWGS
jgi:hypothetical protein